MMRRRRRRRVLKDEINGYSKVTNGDDRDMSDR